MDYQKHYDLLIARARSRLLTGYTERHHVRPRCLGGGDGRANVVRLTPEEHYVAHQLLVKMHPGHRGLLWAAMAMTGGSARQSRSNRIYGWLRRRFAAAMAVAGRARTHSPESRAKMSLARLGRKRGASSPETRAKIGAAHRGRSKSAAHRAAMSAGRRGKKRKPHSETTKIKMRASQAVAVLTRDQAYMRTEAYRAAQSENMKRVWAERRARKVG